MSNGKEKDAQPTLRAGSDRRIKKLKEVTATDPDWHKKMDADPDAALRSIGIDGVASLTRLLQEGTGTAGSRLTSRNAQAVS